MKKTVLAFALLLGATMTSFGQSDYEKTKIVLSTGDELELIGDGSSIEEGETLHILPNFTVINSKGNAVGIAVATSAMYDNNLDELIINLGGADGKKKGSGYDRG